MICKACNAENKDGALFCANCGATLEQESVVVEATEVAPEIEVATDPGKGLGITALILGIAGLVLATLCACGCSCTLPIASIIPSGVGFILSVVGMILGIVASKKSKAAGCKNTMATIGMILGIVGVVLGIVSIVVGIIFGIIGGVGTLMTAAGSSYSDPYAYSYYGY